MKNGQELLDALEEVLEWTDQWEDLDDWIDMADYTSYDEDSPPYVSKTSWCRTEEYKDIWAIEVVTHGKNRSGGGWFSDDVDIRGVDINWEWCDGNGEWWGPYKKGGSTKDKENAHIKFREWVEKNPSISEELENCGSTLSKVDEETHEEEEKEEKEEVVLDGLFTRHYGNGQTEKEEHYKDGKRVGRMTYWYETGQKKWEGHWKDGKEDGTWTYWDEEGNIRSIEKWKDGGRVD